MNHPIFIPSLKFPTPDHKRAAEAAAVFFLSHTAVDTILVENSCARGQAVPESDLDMAVLLRPQTTQEEISQHQAAWNRELATNQSIVQFQAKGNTSDLHLDLIDGHYIPETWDDDGGPDGFELQIGNYLAYAAPMQEAGPFYLQLQGKWLPYYDENLRAQRLEMVVNSCLYDLDQIPFFVRRELYFQAFDRL
jgi:predicted nucleotidyltransferase